MNTLTIVVDRQYAYSSSKLYKDLNISQNEITHVNNVIAEEHDIRNVVNYLSYLKENNQNIVFTQTIFPDNYIKFRNNTLGNGSVWEVHSSDSYKSKSMNIHLSKFITNDNLFIKGRLNNPEYDLDGFTSVNRNEISLVNYVKNNRPQKIIIIGLVTNICVHRTAMTAKRLFPNIEVSVNTELSRGMSDDVLACFNDPLCPDNDKKTLAEIPKLSQCYNDWSRVGIKNTVGYPIITDLNDNSLNSIRNSYQSYTTNKNLISERTYYEVGVPFDNSFVKNYISSLIIIIYYILRLKFTTANIDYIRSVTNDSRYNNYYDYIRNIDFEKDVTVSYSSGNGIKVKGPHHKLVLLDTPIKASMTEYKYTMDFIPWTIFDWSDSVYSNIINISKDKDIIAELSTSHRKSFLIHDAAIKAISTIKDKKFYTSNMLFSQKYNTKPLDIINIQFDIIGKSMFHDILSLRSFNNNVQYGLVLNDASYNLLSGSLNINCDLNIQLYKYNLVIIPDVTIATEKINRIISILKCYLIKPIFPIGNKFVNPDLPPVSIPDFIIDFK